MSNGTDNSGFDSFKDQVNKHPLFGTSDDLPRVVEIELENLQPNPNQARKHFDEEALKELAHSIEKHGLIQPITVQKHEEDESFIIVAGERRYRAHELLGLESIAAIISSGHPDEISLIENIQRENLNPIEEAEGVAQLIEKHEYTQEEAAQVIGKARSTVTHLLGITQLPAQVKEECATSHPVSKSVLIELAKLDQEKEQLRVWEEIKGGPATVRAARKAKKKKQNRRSADEKAPAEKLHDALRTGQSFVRRLERTPPSTVTPDSDEYKMLVALREQINNLLGKHISTDDN